jgi:hypothetical protein
MDSVTVTLTLTPDKRALQGVFQTALDGGIGYWSNCLRYRWAKAGTDECDLDGFHAEIEDAYEGAKYTINGDTILRGLLHFAKPGGGYPHVRQAALMLLIGQEVDYDAEDADAIVQAGLFGEVVYG